MEDTKLRAFIQNTKQWKTIHTTQSHYLRDTKAQVTPVGEVAIINGVNVNGLKTNAWSSSLTAGKSPCTAEEMKEDDGFYQKLNKLNESSGLSLLFNFRDTSVDLQEFYKFVIERGGYHQVTKDGTWEDIASSLNQKNQVSLTPSQLQKLYATILYSFEQAYHYRCPEKHSRTPYIPLESWDLTNFTGKRKHDDRCYTTHDQFSAGAPSKKIEYDNGAPKTSPEEKKPVLETPEKVKETRKKLRVPLGSRNCYQMFTKMEGDRIRSIYGDSVDIRDMVARAWRNLSDDDKRVQPTVLALPSPHSKIKLPYIEASKRDKERFTREMAVYEEHKSKKHKQSQTSTKKVINFSIPTFINFETPSLETDSGGSHTTSRHCSVNEKVVDFGQSSFAQNDGDYHVALQPDDSHEIARVSNESLVQKAVELMKNARPNDPIFQINWDAYDV